MKVQPTKVQSLYKGKIEIAFYEKSHMYKLNGERLISVTACTGIIDKSGPLMYWAVNLAKEYLMAEEGSVLTKETIEEACKQHRIKKKEAGDIGSQVHEWAENFIKGVDQEMPTDEKVLNGVIAFKKWVEEHKVKFIASEKLVYSKKHGFVGLMDAVAKIKGKLIAVDFKTSKSGDYPEYKFQLSAYRGADEEESGVKYDRSIIAHFGKEDGEFKIIECEEHEKDYKTFLSCLAIKKRIKEVTAKK